MEIRQRAFSFFTTNEIRPKGWLKEQLQIQAEGLSGNLHRFWPDISDSKWIGGKAEGWERVPYWLDGFVPMAYLLDNAELKNVASKYIDTILNRQQDDGWLCPTASDEERAQYDSWGVIIILKALMTYYECTGCRKVYEAIYRALKQFNRHLDIIPLNGWGQMRWFELIPVCETVYSYCGEQWLLDLVLKLRCQGFDYAEFYRNFPFRGPVEKSQWSMLSHIVNNLMAVKADALYYLFRGDKQLLSNSKKMIKILDRYHGLVTGAVSGDECFNGHSNVAGTELCAIVEFMYSLEQLFSITGDWEYAERLEKLAYNCLFAPFSRDMWSHQYDQQVNQVECFIQRTEDTPFTTNSGESHIFGLEPHYGCCTANFSQGLPKFILSSFLRSADGIVMTGFCPAVLNTEIDGIKVAVDVDTAYPFGDEVRITVKTSAPVDFVFYFSARDDIDYLSINGENSGFIKEKGYIRIKRNWLNDVIEIRFKPEIKFIRLKNGLRTVTRGPLVFSLKIEEHWNPVERGLPFREYPHCDYEVLPASDFAYAIAEMKAEIKRNPIIRSPYYDENPPIELLIDCEKIRWEKKNGMASPNPLPYRGTGIVTKKRFVPFATAKLRITELPAREDYIK